MEITRLDRIYKMLYDLEYNRDFMIEPNTTPATRANFIEEIKAYIRCEYDKLYGYSIELSDDNTKLRKVHI